MDLIEAIAVAVEALTVQRAALETEAGLYWNGATTPAASAAWNQYVRVSTALAKLKPLGERKLTAYNDMTIRTIGIPEG